jgi:short-subunit dehydrogenase
MVSQNNSNESGVLTTLGWIAAGVGALVAANKLYQEYNKFNFNGKVVLITGGSRGLGLVLARSLTLKGAKIAICARSIDQLRSAKIDLEKLSANKVLAIQTDLTNREEARDMVDQVVAHYGRLDVLINNAGIVQVGPLNSMTIEDFEDAMKTNFWAAVYTIFAAMPHFEKRGAGRVVNITSIGGKIPVPHLLPYTASKFAFTGFSEGLHTELKEKNILVTTVVPHLMRTGSPRNIIVKGSYEEEYTWFKASDSAPLLSQDVRKAAQKIISGIEYGDSEIYVGLTAKLAALVHGISPSFTSTFLTLANKFLPHHDGQPTPAKKGYEIEPKLSGSKIGLMTDVEAIRNNEL